MLRIFRPMSVIFSLTIFFLQMLIAGCNNNVIENKEIIKKIESEINLPKSSSEIGEYSRFYSGNAESIVQAVYVIQKLEGREFIKKDCIEGDLLSYPCNDPKFGIIEPNATKWLYDVKNLPVQNGGGCSYIEIKYDVKTSTFIQIECNGSR